MTEIADKGWLSISETALTDLIISSWSAKCPALFLVIDGIDELPESEQKKLLSFMKTINTSYGVVCKSFITCRLGEGRLDAQLARIETLGTTIDAQTVTPDIEKIVNHSLDSWQPGLSHNDVTALKLEISRILTTQSGEM